MSPSEPENLSVESSHYFRELQDRICAAIESLENRGGGTGRFREDTWEYKSGGGGISRVMLEGTVFEKAGVNFSRVRGTFSDELAASMPGGGTAFTATGISLVLHPRNPHVPTVHANFRNILKGSPDTWSTWFGGGADLTPFYPCRDDVVHFHQVWKKACATHSAVADHARFKKWCDEYFYLPHRNECRGVGGIFFDYLSERLHEVFAFVRAAGDQFLPAYVPIVERRMATPWTDAQRRWQLVRRGRYVEFNLLYDRGTMFGLKTGGRAESILMSLPPHVMWGYDERPEPGSPEAELLEYLKPRDWTG
jgi:coproporphyrinogen III oxidase